MLNQRFREFAATCVRLIQVAAVVYQCIMIAVTLHIGNFRVEWELIYVAGGLA